MCEQEGETNKQAEIEQNWNFRIWFSQPWKRLAELAEYSRFVMEYQKDFVWKHFVPSAVVLWGLLLYHTLRIGGHFEPAPSLLKKYYQNLSIYHKHNYQAHVIDWTPYESVASTLSSLNPPLQIQQILSHGTLKSHTCTVYVYI